MLHVQGGSLPWPAELTAAGYPYKRSDLWTGEMHVPNTRGEWPAELGGQMYPPERGPSSRTFIELLKVSAAATPDLPVCYQAAVPPPPP